MKKNTKPKKECFICYNDNKKAIKPLSNFITKKKCKCDNYIHERCLKKWISIRKCCPMCNSKIDEPDEPDEPENTVARDLTEETYTGHYIRTNYIIATFYRDNTGNPTNDSFITTYCLAIVFQFSYIIISLIMGILYILKFIF